MNGKFARVLGKGVARLLRNEEGPSGTEYAILLALLILGSMAVIGAIGSSMQVIYENINAAVDDVFG